tara:strand:+ start:144 stop:542 length:399 start_codon:yes stop_codon:yes gene_type:complete
MYSSNNYFYDDSDQYDVEKLWRITKYKKVKKIDTEELIPLTKQRAWGDKIRSPFGIINTPPVGLVDSEMDHLKRIFRANLSYPILIYENYITSEYFMVDGMHRLVKSILFNMCTIKYVQITDYNMSRSYVRQ